MSGGPVPVTFVVPSGDVGGAERALEALLERLAGGWVREIVVLAPGPAAERLAAYGRVTVVPTSARAGILTSALRLRGRLGGATVVHANGVKAALVAALALWGRDVPVVWVRHDFSWEGRLARWLAGRCRTVVGVSRAVTAGLDGTRADVRVVANGLPPLDADAPRGRAALLAALRAGEDAEVVVQVGRLEAGKGQLDLVELLPGLLAERPAARVALVGAPSRFDPGYADRVRDRARELGVEHALALLGERADALDLLAGADVAAVTTAPYTRPGTGEGFGLVAAEAMALGTPVVAYDHGGLPEVLGDCGVLVAPGDAVALGRALAELLADPERRGALAAAGRERARGFDLDAVAAAMAAVYRDALSA
jgi:glycosyltransferase involved in cell wall biosynthesis